VSPGHSTFVIRTIFLPVQKQQNTLNYSGGQKEPPHPGEGRPGGKRRERLLPAGDRWEKKPLVQPLKRDKRQDLAQRRIEPGKRDENTVHTRGKGSE